MHEAVTVEGLYCTDITGYQAANSFLPMVQPLAMEMIFQLSNIKVAWTNKLTKQFHPPHPEVPFYPPHPTNVVYHLYLRRDYKDEDSSLLQWLRSHSTAGKKANYLGQDKNLVVVKFVSPFNLLFFFQHLLVHHPHCTAADLRHLGESSMAPAIQFFAQAVTLRPENWTTS